MTALQKRSAIRVFPGVLVIQIVLAVLCAPLLAGERWSTDPFLLAVLGASLVVLAAGTMVLASAGAVAAVVDSGASSDPATRLVLAPRGGLISFRVVGAGTARSPASSRGVGIVVGEAARASSAGVKVACTCPVLLVVAGGTIQMLGHRPSGGVSETGQARECLGPLRFPQHAAELQGPSERLRFRHPR